MTKTVGNRTLAPELHELDAQRIAKVRAEDRERFVHQEEPRPVKST